MTIINDTGNEVPDLLIPPLRFHVISSNLYCGSYPRNRNKRFLEGLGLKTILSITPSPIGGDPKKCQKDPVIVGSKDDTEQERNDKVLAADKKNPHEEIKEMGEETDESKSKKKDGKKSKDKKDKANLSIEDSWLVEFAAAQNIQLIHIPSAPASDKSKKKRGVPLEYNVARLACEYMINQDLSPMYIHCMNGSQVTCLVVACLRKLSFWSMAAISDEFLRYCDMEPADANFVEAFRAEIEVPKNPVPWIWQGLSKTGVVKHHPTIKFNDNERENEQETD